MSQFDYVLLGKDPSGSEYFVAFPEDDEVRILVRTPDRGLAPTDVSALPHDAYDVYAELMQLSQ